MELGASEGMLAKRIIPCLDVRDGRVVKGVQFRGLRPVGEPAAAAFAYQEQGADELVFLDVTASLEARSVLLDTVQKTAEGLFIPLTVGGGIRSLAEIRAALKSGADKVSVNTAAVQDPSLLTRAAERFGRQCIVIAIDAKRRAAGSWEVYIQSGRVPTGLDAIAWAKEATARGAGEILLTSIDADGRKEGYDLELTRRVADAVEVPVIASGGCGTIAHIYDVLTRGKADAALAASIFHFGEHTVGEVKEFLHARGVPVRAIGGDTAAS